MKIGVFLTTTVVMGLCDSAYANPPAELFPEQAKAVPPGAYGLSASSSNVDLSGPSRGSQFISLKLTNGRTVQLEKTGFKSRSSGNALWRGKVPDHTASQALLPAHEGLMFGGITLDCEVYEIPPGAYGQYVAEQLDPSAFPHCDTGDDQVTSGGGTASAFADAADAACTWQG